ncbi:MAG: hypothetical protein ACOZCO_18395 [Bacteroidota bacterium]
MGRWLYVIALGTVLFFACSGGNSSIPGEEKSTHPLHGKWKLAVAGDSVVVNNKNEMFLEFTPEGKIINISEGERVEGTYIVSDDTTLITVMEGGKPVTEYKVYYLTETDLAFKEDEDIVKFVKVK